MSATLSSPILGNILAALLLTLLSGWAGLKFARRLNLIDVPGSAPHKQHAVPTPLAGGLALAIVLVTFSGFLRLFAVPELRAILAGGAVVFTFALIDDYQEIRPLYKLAGQLLAVFVLIRMGVYIRIFESPEFFINGQGGVYVLADWVLTVLWIVGITNAFNFVDSMDGLAVVLAGIAAAFFILITTDSGQPLLTRWSALLLGFCIGLYFYNAPPARLFLGDAGSQSLGFLLATLSIIYTPQGTFQTVSWFTPILILGIPIFDTTLVVFSRLRRNIPIYRSNRDHTYHRLVARGMEPNRAVISMNLAALILGCLAIVSLDLSPLLANAIFLVVLLLGGLLILYLDREPKYLP